MRSKISRRKFLATIGAAAGISSLARPALAQQKPVKIGLMTVKTGGLAAGGVHLEEGITCLLRDKNFTLAGRQIVPRGRRTAGGVNQHLGRLRRKSRPPRACRPNRVRQLLR